MIEYETRVLALIVAPKGEEIFSERATEVRMQDDAGGEFVEVIQSAPEPCKIKINPEEWPALRAAIDRIVADCRGDEGGPE